MMFEHGYGIASCFGFGRGLMHGGLGMITMVLFTALIVAVIVLITKKTQHRHQPDSLALEALKMRLAKGEITEEEYLKRKAVLQ